MAGAVLVNTDIVLPPMDFSLLFDPDYLPIIIGTIVGFGLLAAALLVPVYRFLEREKKVADKWTPEALAERMRKDEQAASNGAEGSAPEEDRNEPRDSTTSSV